MNKKEYIPYAPSKKVLERYADILVNFSLGGNKGIKKGDTVLINCPEIAKPLFIEVRKAIWKAGGNVLQIYRPDEDNRFGISADFIDIATDKQLDFFPEHEVKGLMNQSDHYLMIFADADLKMFYKCDPKRVMRRSEKYIGPFRNYMNKKEREGKLTWNICLYGTPAMANEAGLTEKEYWNQIIKACYLNEKDPVSKWRDVDKKLNYYKKKLTDMNIDKIHMVGTGSDIWIKIGEDRKWLAGGGRNTPSFEVFTSPDWRGTEGWIKFNQPLYYNGNIIKDIKLEFKKGKIVSAKAKQGVNILKEMINAKNADRLGEFSLTDKRMSKITKFMATTLYDENVGGKYGNTHLAVGMAFKDAYKGNLNKLSDKKMKEIGLNDSATHVDIMSTTDRTVTAYMKDGTEKIIYKDGMFTF